jgi:hypothetical protein
MAASLSAPKDPSFPMGRNVPQWNDDASASATAPAALRSCSMSQIDDIPNETPATQTERDVGQPKTSDRRQIGPESEDRGGPEAVDETLDEPQRG